MSRPLADIATPEAVTYARDRATHYETRHPMLALMYRVVAEVLDNERPLHVVQRDPEDAG